MDTTLGGSGLGLCEVDSLLVKAEIGTASRLLLADVVSDEVLQMGRVTGLAPDDPVAGFV
jgi:hypothetical protein